MAHNYIRRFLHVGGEAVPSFINFINRIRLRNKTPTLICSNCTGGFLYHWLGLKFYSPFINLYMDNFDFLYAMENFDHFIATPIIEDLHSGKDYPVGIGLNGVRIHFMHYPNFRTALEKWNERKKRIDKNNIAIMLTNFGSGLSKEDLNDYNKKLENGSGMKIVKRFEQLPFKHKVILSGFKIDSPCAIYLRGFPTCPKKNNVNIFSRSRILILRYIDQFDYVSFINNLKS